MHGRAPSPDAAPNRTFAQALSRAITAGPKGRELLVDRNRPEAHICVGEDDPHLGRHHETRELLGATTIMAPDLPLFDADGAG